MIRLSSLLLLSVLTCAPDPSSTPRPAAQSEGPRVVLPDGFVVRVEVAANAELRAQGLMYRDRLPAGAGMLFFFPAEGEHSFWMKNTRIPLDMIWLDAGRRVVHIEPNVPPCVADPCASYGPDTSSSYVLEIAGGEAAKHGLKAGDQLRFEGTDGVVVE